MQCGRDSDTTLNRLRRLRKSAGADAAAVFTPIIVGGECRAAFRAGVGDETLLAQIGRMHGADLPFRHGACASCIGSTPLLLPPMWTLRLSERCFSPVDADWTEHGFPHPTVCPPVPIAPTLWSTTVNSSGHLIALTVLGRWAAHEPFSDKAIREADQTLDAQGPADGAVSITPAPVTLLYASDGRLVASSESEESHIGDCERGAIGSLARRFLSEGQARHPVVMTLMGELRFERLVGATGDEHIVASLTPPHLFQTLPLRALTLRQREIAAYAASGTSASQLSAGLHVSVNTIKHHLKSIYLRLHVRDRDELRSLLAAA